MDVLTTAPLTTKMLTGAALAVTGDALAQKCDTSRTGYDKRRAASFAIFDMAYRALQHAVYPSICSHFQGQYLCSALLPVHTAAPLERTLCSQLGIVPFLYYPFFFSLTAALQGLNFAAGVHRARRMFGSLMQRNLLFWIPAQFVQFRWVPTALQIPFVSVCGVMWTFILSILAGAATATKKTARPVQSVDCVLPEDNNDREISDQREFEFVTKEFDEVTHALIFDEDATSSAHVLVNGTELVDGMALTHHGEPQMKEETAANSLTDQYWERTRGR